MLVTRNVELSDATVRLLADGPSTQVAVGRRTLTDPARNSVIFELMPGRCRLRVTAG